MDRPPQAKILAIDDAAANLQVLGATLDHDYDLEIATSGDEGLRLARKSPPDLILLDVMMPGMDGFETCRRLKADPMLQDIPVIFLTALGELESEARGLGLGAADYITKPISVEIALLRIRNILERERLRKEVEVHRDHLEELVGARTAELKRAVEELESFSYSISHDLRAPLRAINGFSEILRDGEKDKLSEDGKQMLERIARSAVRLAQMIDDILEYSRSGRQSLKTSSVDLRALANKVAADFRGEYPRTAIRVGELPVVVGVPTMLTQVLQNLIGNACKFSARQNNPEVEIGACEIDGEQVFFVRDNGAGFDMQYADRLFGMFQRMHTDGQYPGTGIGLAIVKRLVERHEGRVWAESEPDKGATFYFTLGTANA